MGARVNFVFKQYENTPSVVLYSHWGADSWEEDLAFALACAKPRWDDPSYGTRIAISRLIGHQWEGETGFGIYASTGMEDPWDLCVEVDFINKTVNGKSFDKFVNYHTTIAEAEQEFNNA